MLFKLAAASAERSDTQQCTEGGVEHFRATPSSIFVLKEGRWEDASSNDKPENCRLQSSTLRPFTSSVYPNHFFRHEGDNFSHPSLSLQNAGTDYFQVFYRRKRVLKTSDCLDTYPGLQSIHRQHLVPSDQQRQLSPTSHWIMPVPDNPQPSSLLLLMGHTGNGTKHFYTEDQKVQQKIRKLFIPRNPPLSSLLQLLMNHTGNGTLQLSTGQPSQRVHGEGFSQSHSYPPQTDDHLQVRYHHEKASENDDCPTSLYAHTDNKLLQNLRVFCRQCLVPPDQQGRLDPTCPSSQIMPDRGVGGLQPAFCIEKLQDGSSPGPGKDWLLLIPHTPLLPSSSLLWLLKNCPPHITGSGTPQPCNMIGNAYNLQNVDHHHQDSKLNLILLARVEKEWFLFILLPSSHFFHVLLLSILVLHSLFLMVNRIVRVMCDLFYMGLLTVSLCTVCITRLPRYYSM